MISSLIDQSDLPSVRSNQNKTKRRRTSRPIFSKEVHVENDRVSTLDMFLASGYRNFPKIQVDAIADSALQ